MDTVKATGKNVENAVKAAAEILRAVPEEIEYKIITEGEGGILGIGGKPAEIEAWIKKDDPEIVKEIVQKILDLMEYMALASVVNQDPDGATIEIKGEDLGRIIGKQGGTLDSMQMLVNVIVGRQFGRRYRVVLDAAGYREKRNETLEKIARDAEDKVQSSGREVVLEPMPASERRIIHLTLQDSNAVSTFSEGDRAMRRVVVAPKDKESKNREEFAIGLPASEAPGK